jgi:endoglucanase
MSIQSRASLLQLVLFTGLPLFGADFTMKVTDNGYLDTQGFSVILYSSTFHPVFVDQPYKQRLLEIYPAVLGRFAFGGWTAVRALPYMDDTFKKQLEEAVKAYVTQLDKDLAASPFGVPPSLGTWGGSVRVADLGVGMYFLHKAFPEIVSTDYTLSAVNYLLGTHPYSSTSYVSAVGTSSKLKAYGNNRADNTFIPGGLIPGYIIIKPDFPECIDDFGFLWFEHEYTIGAASKWILAANAADALARR